jgi:hypothetical protein
LIQLQLLLVILLDFPPTMWIKEWGYNAYLHKLIIFFTSNIC